MLPIVKTKSKNLKDYQALLSADLLNEINALAHDLQGLRVFHVNATPRGGGVAELLSSLVPFMKGVGLAADWYTIPPQGDFFKITKKLHNALQGGRYEFSAQDQKDYLVHIQKVAALMGDMQPDLWIIHDPQPAGAIKFLSLHPAICRVHIDLTTPNQAAWEFVLNFLNDYDRIILSSADFVKPEIKDKVDLILPAIDVLASKNSSVPLVEADAVLKSFNINPERPIVAQISRFDPWKNPIGAIEAYQIAKQKIPGLQLVLVGLMIAQDDPEAAEIYKEVKQKAGDDPDIFIFADVQKLGSLKSSVFINMVQAAADVILQNSIREGFGLTVTEGMWKQKAVIGGAAGGIKIQIQNGVNGFISNDTVETAEHIVTLINDPALRQRFGQLAHKSVLENFLMPRLLRDHLRLYKKVLNSK